ncbi:MAG: hypothetical protein DDT19_01905 [Syntrophomonadaceae bacterium]|nr:hypothetical protein [Bacillota bacterium]
MPDGSALSVALENTVYVECVTNLDSNPVKNHAVLLATSGVVATKDETLDVKFTPSHHWTGAGESRLIAISVIKIPLDGLLGSTDVPEMVPNTL